MAVDFIQKSAGNSASTTLSSAVSNTDTSFPLTSDTAFLSGGGLVIIDEGQSAEELAYYTGKVGASLTIPLANRGLEGGSAQAHSSGATVKGIMSADMWNNHSEALLNLVSVTTGALDTTKVVDLTTAQTLTNKTLTSPVLNGAIAGDAIATGTTINTGTANDDIVTSKAITDSNIPNEVIVPSTIVANDGATNLTTDSTTELTIISKTITNPAVAGRILLMGELNMASSTAVGDVFTYRLYFGTTPTQLTITTVTTLSSGRHIVSLSGVASVAASGTQIAKITAQRTGGTGTVTALNGNCSLSWIIVSGATSTA